MGWNKKQRFVGYFFIAPNLLGITAFYILPSLFSLVLSFTDWNFMDRGSVHFVGIDNFIRLFKDESFYTALKNTFIFLMAVPISIGLALIIAVVLNKHVYLKSILRAMYFLPYITSGVAVAFIWMVIFEPNQGPVNSFLKSAGISNPPGWLSATETSMISIDIIWIWFMIGYNMIIYLAALQEIPTELTEASKIDGAKPIHTFLYIIAPLVSPSTFLLMITGMIVTLKQFGIIQAITQGGPGDSTTVLSLQIYKMAFRYYEMGYASAIAWVLFMIILLITYLQWYGQKKWVHY